MYSKKIDERMGEQSDANNKLPPHSKRSTRPPPAHEFVYRWFRGPRAEVCAYEGCRRRTSFSPTDWSTYALSGGNETYKNKMKSVLYNTSGGKDGSVITSNILCTLQCVSTQSSLYRSTFCNARCFVDAWRTHQHTLRLAGQGGNALLNGTSPGLHKRMASSASSGGWCASAADDASVGSVGSSATPVYTPYSSSLGENCENDRKSPIPSILPTSPIPGTGEFMGTVSRSNSQGYSANNPYATLGDNDADADDIGWVEISRNAYYIPTEMDVGRKLSLEASAVSVVDGEVLMQRVVKTDLVLSQAPEPKKRNLITVKGANSSGGGARFRIATYNALAEIYATQQQYPYCDFWALSWEYR